MTDRTHRSRAKLVGWSAAGLLVAGASVFTTIGIANSAPNPAAGQTALQKAQKADPAAQPKPQVTKQAKLKAPAAIATDLVAEVVTMKSVHGDASAPGEIAGPAVRFTIRISNDTGSTVNLANTVVNAYYGADATPAVQLDKPGGRPFPTSIANGKSATGSFVFTIPADQRDTVKVTVDTAVDKSVVAFTGVAPN
jgi:hypothetical protein